MAPSGQTSNPLRKLASGTPPEIRSTSGKVACFPLMTLDLGAKRWGAVWGTASNESGEKCSSPTSCDMSFQPPFGREMYR